LKEEPLSLEELKLFNRRELIIRGVISLPFIGCVWRLWNLQIKSGEKYRELSKGNRIRLNSVAAPRGIIYDRNGLVLSKNIPAFNLMLVREDTDDIETVLRKISVTLQIRLESMHKALVSNKRVAKYEPIILFKDLSWYQVALISAYQEEFPGISIEIASRRFFPNLQSGAHIYGYMNKITKGQLRELPVKKLMSAKIVGQEGIEKVYNDRLIGTDGGVQVEVDSTGRIIKTLNSIDPYPGEDLRLNIDSKLQKKVEKIFGERQGAAIMMDPKNGEVFSLVSLPSFDPNEFSQGLTQKRWDYLSSHPSKILHNKCIQGTYSPGSTFKMIVGIAALEMGLIDENTEQLCEGYFRYNRTQVHCWKRSGHGNLNVVQALENSCNIFFYKIALEVGVDKIYEYSRKFGLGLETGIDLSNENNGVIPNKEWKQKKYNEVWYPGETLPVGIGQGYVSVTPIQLLNYISSIANDGYVVKPRVVKAVIRKIPDEEDEKKRFRTQLNFTEVQRRKIDLLPTTLNTIREGMRLNVQGKNGTGIHARSDLVSIAGKTGTTQVVSYKTRAKIKKETGTVDLKYFDHAWFAGFAPFDDPQVAIALIIENGKSGRHAALLVKEILEYYFTEISPIEKKPPPPEETLQDKLI